MRELLFFILGTLFYVFFLPVVEQITSLIVQKLEAVKGKYNVEVISRNVEAEKISSETDYQVSNAIGFEVPTYEEYEEEDFDE